MFGGDPFGDPFATPSDSRLSLHMRQMHRQMDNMMNAMMQDPFGLLDGFGRPQQQMIDDGRGGSGRRGNGAVSRRTHPMDDMMLNPFGGFGLGGGLFGGMMQQMNHLQQHAMNDPNSVVFTQSTMISHDGTGQPRIVQQSTRKAGEVKETRRQVKNGMEDEEISVGHSIGDRAHVIEKKRDKDGRMRSQQRFVNLDEDEAERFNHEFKSRAAEGLGVGGYRSGPRYQAIDNGNSRRHGGRHSNGETSTSGSTPIVEIPDDDEDDTNRRNGSEHKPQKTKRYSRSRGRDEYYNNRRDGPTIREISDEEADMSIPKRRKGLFGKFFSANDE